MPSDVSVELVTHVAEVQPARRKIALGLRCRSRIERGIEDCRIDTGLGERRHLVLHERDQRRYDHGTTCSHERGKLVAQRLSAASGHQHQRVAAACDMLDDLGLRAAK